MDRGSQERVSHSGFYIASLQLTTAKHTTAMQILILLPKGETGGSVCILGGWFIFASFSTHQRLPMLNCV